jgi:hypothetical protein
MIDKFQEKSILFCINETVRHPLIILITALPKKSIKQQQTTDRPKKKQQQLLTFISAMSNDLLNFFSNDITLFWEFETLILTVSEVII